MEAHRLGNDIDLIITSEELSQLEQITKKGIVFTSKIQSQQDSPLNGKEIQLIYVPDLNADGVDGIDMISRFDNPPIPVYIGHRGIKRLQQREYCMGCIGIYNAKIDVKVQN